MPSVRLERLAFAYADAAPILTGADLTLPAGFTAVVGENGAGKTTLLALVAGALAPSSGRVRLDPPSARVALCAQAVDEAGPDAAALAARDDGEARRLRASLRLDPIALDRWPTLSPGARKRWQVTAALAAEPCQGRPSLRRFRGPPGPPRGSSPATTRSQRRGIAARRLRHEPCDGRAGMTARARTGRAPPTSSRGRCIGRMLLLRPSAEVTAVFEYVRHRAANGRGGSGPRVGRGQ